MPRFKRFTPAEKAATPQFAAAEARQTQLENDAKARANALRSQNMLGAAEIYNEGMGDKSPISDGIRSMWNSAANNGVESAANSPFTQPTTSPFTQAPTPDLNAGGDLNLNLGQQVPADPFGSMSAPNMAADSFGSSAMPEMSFDTAMPSTPFDVTAPPDLAAGGDIAPSVLEMGAEDLATDAALGTAETALTDAATTAATDAAAGVAAETAATAGAEAAAGGTLSSILGAAGSLATPLLIAAAIRGFF